VSSNMLMLLVYILLISRRLVFCDEEGQQILKSYSTLSSSSHGRHLLVLSQLEELSKPYWHPRCGGAIRLCLPRSLAAKDQPKNKDIICQQLLDIKTGNGTILDRQDVIRMINNVEDFLLIDDTFTKLRREHVRMLNFLVNFMVSLPTFDSCFSMLVVMKEFLSSEFYVECVSAVIQSRPDVGYVEPSPISVQPEIYFPGLNLTELKSGEVMNSLSTRMKRQAVSWAKGYMVEIPYHDIKTLPDSEPESKMWYFREDPLLNANHFHWHQVVANDEVFRNDPMHSSNIDRRGEMFYFMHKQLLCRANLERLSVGLEVSKPYGPNEWTSPLFPGYDSKLGFGASKKYAPRPDGAVMFSSDARKLSGYEEKLRTDIEYGRLLVGGKYHELEYSNGVDRGISILGDVVQSYRISKYGDLHNTGHTIISDLHKDEGTGVMATPNVAMRDPIFSRWHKYIDDIFLLYKNKFGPYTDEDLSFDDVHIMSMSVKTDHDEHTNVLHTFMNHSAFVQLWSLDLTKAGSSSVGVKYKRLEHHPFTYNFEITSLEKTRGIMRIFLIPAEIPSSSPHVKVSQLAVEMDRFHVELKEGKNYIQRKSIESTFTAKKRRSLYELQKMLLEDSISQDEFNWGGCGWPQEMLLPRGREDGMEFHLLAVLSPFIMDDAALTADWNVHNAGIWSWCGVRSDEGGMPDSRPMGFPLDRSPPMERWQSLLNNKKGRKRSNVATVSVEIVHTP